MADDKSTREAGADVANVGTGRERPVVGRSERRRERETRPSLELDAEVRQRASTDDGRAPPDDQPATSSEEAAEAARRVAADAPSSGYAGRADREDPSAGLGGNQTGLRQSHELPGVGNRPSSRDER